MADLLYDYDPTDKVIDYIKLEEPSADALLQKLAELTDQDPDSNVEFDTLIDLYCAAGILEEREDGSYIARRKKEFEEAEDADSGQGQSHTESENDLETTQEVDQQPSKRDQISEDGSSVSSQKAVEYSVNIDLQVDGDDDPIEVAKLVVAISKALEDDLDADLKVESDDGEQGQAQLTLDSIDAT